MIAKAAKYSAGPVWASSPGFVTTKLSWCKQVLQPTIWLSRPWQASFLPSRQQQHQHSLSPSRSRLLHTSRPLESMHSPTLSVGVVLSCHWQPASLLVQVCPGTGLPVQLQAITKLALRLALPACSLALAHWHCSELPRLLQVNHLEKWHPAMSQLIPEYPGIIQHVTYPGISLYKQEKKSCFGICKDFL